MIETERAPRPPIAVIGGRSGIGADPPERERAGAIDGTVGCQEEHAERPDRLGGSRADGLGQIAVEGTTDAQQDGAGRAGCS